MEIFESDEIDVEKLGKLIKEIIRWNFVRDRENLGLVASNRICVMMEKVNNSFGDVVLLEGTLGSGKTFLVQEICKNWHIEEDVTSPTFTLIQNYNGDLDVNHLDLYRIENVEELDQLGWEDMVYSKGVTFIEWPQMVEPVLQSYYKIKIDLQEDRREITLSRVE